ncbi:MAG: NAD(P) transhydrogenase subunit alpha [Bryobacteraceae bacterium]
MRIFVPREDDPGESRVSLLPDDVGRLVRAGADIYVEAGLGVTIGLEASAYEHAGAKITADRPKALAEADLILRLNKPSLEEIPLIREGAIHVSFLDPFRTPEFVRAMNLQRTSAISLEMIPRSTIAQKMDVLSSQANLAGYAAVLLAADRLDRILPMMMTPAGTISPGRVFIIGVGVAGLQAIATAKRLGARVDAFDVRPETEEQVKSLGAKFLKIDLGGDTAGTAQGYAKELTKEQIELQRQAMAKQCAQSDIVIAAAQVFGRKAPRLVTADMRSGMRPGAVIVDLAVETGGNVEGSELDREVTIDGVHILGYSQMARRVPAAASQMLSSNLVNFVQHFWDKEAKAFQMRLDDDILKGCLITHQGEIRNEKVRDLANAATSG